MFRSTPTRRIAKSAIDWLGLCRCACVSLICGWACASAQFRYTYHEVESFIGDDPALQTSAAWAIDRAGRVIGATSTGPFRSAHASLWREGREIDLGVLYASAFSSSSAYGINDRGVSVGQSHVNGSDPPQAVVWRRDGARSIGTGYGPSSFSRAWDVNNAGRIVGERGRSQSAPVRAFVWRDGRFIDLGSLGGSGGAFGTTSVAYAINESDQIVGAALPPNGPLHGFVWQDGQMRDLGTLGGNGEATVAQAVNDRGQIVGRSPSASGAVHAFLWQAGTMHDLGTLGGNTSEATGINYRGQIVGGSRTSASPPFNAGRAFLWEHGAMVDLNEVVINLPDDVTLEIARAINDTGVIVGYTCTAFCEPGKTAPTRGFVLVPMPAAGTRSAMPEPFGE